MLLMQVATLKSTVSHKCHCTIILQKFATKTHQILFDMISNIAPTFCVIRDIVSSMQYFKQFKWLKIIKSRLMQELSFSRAQREYLDTYGFRQIPSTSFRSLEDYWILIDVLKDRFSKNNNNSSESPCWFLLASFYVFINSDWQKKSGDFPRFDCLESQQQQNFSRLYIKRVLAENLIIRTNVLDK